MDISNILCYKHLGALWALQVPFKCPSNAFKALWALWAQRPYGPFKCPLSALMSGPMRPEIVVKPIKTS